MTPTLCATAGYGARVYFREFIVGGNFINFFSPSTL